MNPEVSGESTCLCHLEGNAVTKDLPQRGFDTPRLKKSGPLSHQFIIAIPYKAIAAMRNLFKLCSAFYYFNCSFFLPLPNPEKSGETNLPAFLGRQEKSRLTNFSLKFYNTFTSIFTFEFCRPFSKYIELIFFSI